MPMPHKRATYFLRSGDAIKIGCTTRMYRRLPDIEKAIGNRCELLGWIYGSFATEKMIHKYLAAHDEGEEWFADCPQVRALLAYLLEKGPHFQGLPPK